MVRVNKSVEQAVFVMMVLALQEGHRPLQGSVLSRILDVSDSYLKKTLRKLVVAGLVRSSAGHEGGFSIARGADEVTLGDVYRAVDGEPCDLSCAGLAERVFPDCKHTEEATAAVVGAFRRASGAYEAVLADYPLSAFLAEGSWQDGVVDWNGEPAAAGSR